MKYAMKSHFGPGIRMRNLGWILLIVAPLFLAAIPAKAAEATTADAADAQELVSKARPTFQSVVRDPNMAWFRDHLKEAKGIFIVPQLLKGAFFVGGSGGSGVFLVRDEKSGEWSEPAFFTLGSASFGLQFGAESSEVVLMVLTQRGVESMLTSTLKLGADASVAIGPVGGKVEGATANLSADIISFARSKGLFAGVSLDGAVIAERKDLNSAYYGKDVRVLDILVNRKVSNAQSAELRATVGEAAAGK